MLLLSLNKADITFDSKPSLYKIDITFDYKPSLNKTGITFDYELLEFEDILKDALATFILLESGNVS